MSYYPSLEILTSDQDVERKCPGATKLRLQISTAAVYITFGTGRPAEYSQPQPFLPMIGSIPVKFDAFKVRSRTPGQPAQVMLTPLTPND